MKKIRIKEFKRVILVVDIILYCIILFLGLTILEYGSLIDTNILILVQVLLNVICFFSILAYCANRRKNDYEFLLFGFVNVLVSAFLLINDNFSDVGLIIGNGMLVYNISYIIIKMYSAYKLYKERNINFLPKFCISAVIFAVGAYLSILLYTKVNIGGYILGNYFLLFGLLSLIEPLMIFLFRNPTLEKRVKNVLKYETTNNKKETIKMRELPKKRPTKINKTNNLN